MTGASRPHPVAIARSRGSRATPGAAAVVLSEKATAPDPVRQARRAFGFPPATRAVEG
jgi:hypothetical protein